MSHQCITPLGNSSTDTYQVFPQHYVYYSIEVPADNRYALTVTLNQLSGSIDTSLYALKTNLPSTSTYDYSSSSTTTNPKTMIIPACSLSTGTWYFAVYSYNQLPFQISSSLGK